MNLFSRRTSLCHGMQCILVVAFIHLGVRANAQTPPIGPPWTLQTDTTPWGPRREFVMVTLLDGSILVMGGEASLGRMNDVWQSSAEDAGRLWKLQNEDAAWAYRKLFGAVSLSDGSVIIMGGMDGGYQTFADVWRSTDSGISWQAQTTTAEWSARSGFGAVSLRDDSILVLAGTGEVADIWRSAPGDAGSTWTLQLLNAPWDPRTEFGTAVVIDQTSGEERIMILGGFNETSSVYKNDVWLGVADGTSWQQRTASAPWSGRIPSVVVTLDGSVWVVGGGKYEADKRTFRPYGDIWRSPPESYGADWELLTATTGWSPRIGGSACITKGTYMGSVILAAGMEANSRNRGVSTGDVWRTKLPCGVQSPLNGNLGNCPTSPEKLESDLACQPTCNSGYSMPGDFNCSDGFLSTKTCDPNPCDASTPPQNGNVGNCPATLPSNSLCQPTCNNGYTVSGPSSCELGNLTPATCLREPCSVQIPDYAISGNCSGILESGQGCLPICFQGYSLSEPTSCYLGALTKSVCLPNPCPNANMAPLNGSAGNCPAILVSNASCQPTCDEGFRVSGPSTCLLGELSPASCSPKSCNTTEAQDPGPSNGFLRNCPTVLSSGSTCELICDNGYDRVGNVSCNLGTLSQATCNPKPCQITSLPSHSTRGNCPNQLLSGEVCRPWCLEGYNLSGDLRCMLGELSPVLCVPESCAILVPFNGGRGSCNNTLSHGEECQPTCNNGFLPSGPTRCHFGNLNLTVCEPMHCSPVNAPEFGDLGNCPLTLQHGDSCQPTCWNGYNVVGPYQCLLGNLSSMRCDPNPCVVSSPPVHATLGDCPNSLPSGSTCRPACSSGYSLTREAYCSLGNLTQAVCTPDPCYDADTPPLNGQSGDCPTFLLSNESCQHRCDFGYDISGESFCDRGTLERALCVPRVCKQSAIPVHGSIGNCPQPLVHGVICQPACNQGYMPSGPARCFNETLTPMECLPSPCIFPAPENGNQGDCIGFLESGNSCQPECDDGYDSSGPTACYLGVTDATRCTPSPCNVTANLLDNQIGYGDCPHVLPSGESCLPQCGNGFLLSNPLTCRLGTLGIATLAGLLRTPTSTLKCHPELLPMCMAKPCYVGDAAGSDCPVVLPSGASCISSCKSGLDAAGITSCFLGEVTLADCLPTATTTTSSTITSTTTTTTTSTTTTSSTRSTTTSTITTTLGTVTASTSSTTTSTTYKFLSVISTSQLGGSTTGMVNDGTTSTNTTTVSRPSPDGIVVDPTSGTDGDSEDRTSDGDFKLFSFLLGAGVGLMCGLCCCFICGLWFIQPGARKKEEPPMPNNEDSLKETIQKLEQQLQLQLKMNKASESELTGLRPLCESLNEQVQTSLGKEEEHRIVLLSQRSEHERIVKEHERIVKEKDAEQSKLFEEVRILRERVSELCLSLSEERKQDQSIHINKVELHMQNSSSVRSTSQIAIEGPPWQQITPSTNSPQKQREQEVLIPQDGGLTLSRKMVCLLEGSFVEVLPGMQLSQDGQEICVPGDIGTVLSYCQDSKEDDSRDINISWIRSGKICTVAQSSWTWFRFITSIPELGDFLQALPGAGVDAMGEEVSRAGDVGEIVSVDMEGAGTLLVLWPRTGKQSELPSSSWSWFRLFRACRGEGRDVGEEEDISSPRYLDCASISKAFGLNMLLMRAGRRVMEPKEGDIFQVLPGRAFTDDDTSECHNAGEVATVIGMHAKESKEPGAVVSWVPSGHISTISHKYWKSFRILRNPQLRAGDLFVLKTTSSENLSVGDAGSLLSLKHLVEENLQIYWIRTGQVSEYPLKSWSSQFRWIPLQGTAPFVDSPVVSAGVKQIL